MAWGLRKRLADEGEISGRVEGHDGILFKHQVKKSPSFL